MTVCGGGGGSRYRCLYSSMSSRRLASHPSWSALLMETVVRAVSIRRATVEASCMAMCGNPNHPSNQRASRHMADSTGASR